MSVVKRELTRFKLPLSSDPFIFGAKRQSMSQVPKANANATTAPSTIQGQPHKKNSRNKNSRNKNSHNSGFSAYTPKSVQTLPTTNSNNAPPPPSPLPPSPAPPSTPSPAPPLPSQIRPQPCYPPQSSVYYPLPPHPSYAPNYFSMTYSPMVYPPPPLYAHTGAPPAAFLRSPLSNTFFGHHSSAPPRSSGPTSSSPPAFNFSPASASALSPSPAPFSSASASSSSPAPSFSSTPAPPLFPSFSAARAPPPRQSALPEPPRFTPHAHRGGPPRKPRNNSQRAQSAIYELIQTEISRNSVKSDGKVSENLRTGDGGASNSNVENDKAKNSTSPLPEELVGENPDIMKEVVPAESETQPIAQCECGKKFEKQLSEDEWTEHKRTRGHKMGLKLLEAQTSVELEAREIHPSQVLQAGKAITPSILQFFEEVRPSQEDQEKRQRLCKWLERHIRTIYPEASVLLFGSSACNLYFKNSDVDLCALLGDNAQQHNQWSGSDLERTAIVRIAKKLHYEGIHDITKVLHSRVPILKKNTAQITDFAFDLCVERPLGIFNSNLIAYYMTLDPRVQPLLFVLKKWSKCVGINDSQKGRLSSYCINCMLIYFLQTRVPAVLPNLQANPQPPKVMVNGYDCAFERYHGFKSKNTTPIGVLLLDFFHYYGFLFDFEHDTVSIKMGQDPPPKKSVFSWANPMCVQDPFETDFNLSRNVTLPTLLEILFQFQTAYIDVCNMQDLSLLWEIAE
eukprot:Phypoly_transcript_03792.p1 GENE.Phypoly_transcript_03792~~Phypoly_transcript_03792.p1  ORF type:complete len:737 (+),score=161.50 Phypoly_transcript_03792:38-2248(+)